MALNTTIHNYLVMMDYVSSPVEICLYKKEDDRGKMLNFVFIFTI